MPEGPNKRPWESSEPVVEGTLEVEPADEPTAPEQADEDLTMTEATHPEQAPVAPPTAPRPMCRGPQTYLVRFHSVLIPGVRQLFPHC